MRQRGAHLGVSPRGDYDFAVVLTGPIHFFVLRVVPRPAGRTVGCWAAPNLTVGVSPQCTLCRGCPC
eukprot:4893912-Pyramimonas_sp.AAC.1